MAVSLAKRQSKELDGDLNLEELETSVGERATSLYRRESMVEATWDDFELLAIIGRGTFGKVLEANSIGLFLIMLNVLQILVFHHCRV